MELTRNHLYKWLYSSTKSDEEKIKNYLWPIGSNTGAGVCFSQCIGKHGQCHRDVPEHSPSSNRSHKGEDITNNYFED